MDEQVTLLTHIRQSLSDIGILATVAMIFGLVRVLLSTEKMPIHYHLVSLFISVTMGTIVGIVALESGVLPFLTMAITSGVSIVSRDIVSGVLDKSWQRALAQRAVDNLVDKATK